MPLLSGTLPQSLPLSTQATMSPKRTRNSGSTSHRYTRTPTRVSKVEAKTGASPPCHHPLLHTLLPTPLCQWLPWPEATPPLSTSKAATGRAAAHRCLPTPSQYNEQTAHTTSMHQCTTGTTTLKAMATTIWSFLNGRCTEHCSKQMSNTIEDFGSIRGSSWISALESSRHRGTGDKYPS
jgi:hypothetical protein